ncbi:MAG: phosphate ABC transporter permease PstA [Eubacteriales bacterium]|nr:phosphate ABC transporter permease PstA [Eubacteriales bacterium]
MTGTTAYKNNKNAGSRAIRVVVWTAGMTVGLLFLLITGYILIKGIPEIKASLFERHYNSENVSMLPAILNTLEISLLTLGIAVPVGVAAAVYLCEYAKRGSRLVKLIRVTVETLQGIPSIVYGLFGYLLFVISLGWGYSMIAGVLTLVIMVLPVIIRTAEEALLAVPDSYREGSFGLGAGKVRTVFRIILPSAVPGILAGVILAVGRIAGETAALIFTAGTAGNFTGNLADSARTLSVHMYCLWNEGLYTSEAYATSVILLVMVVGMNAISNFIAKRLVNKNGK